MNVFGSYISSGKFYVVMILWMVNLLPAMGNTLSNDTLGLSNSVEGGAKTLHLKTNLLYDACLVPNIGIEIAYTDSWSVSANWMYADWQNNQRHRYWKTYGGELEVKRWLTPVKKLVKQGAHVGAYIQGMNYDIEWGKRGYQSDTWHLGLGVSYGYSLAIARRLNLDFNIGVGYLGGKYKEYLPMEGCYVWQADKHLRYFGPTKLEVSLAWLIHHNKKGGWR